MTIRTMLALAICLLTIPMAQAHKAETTIPVPGFRPENPAASQFLAGVGTATIAVYPTVVRRADRTAHSFASQERVIAFLNEAGIGKAIAAHRRIDRGRMLPDSQWNIFQGGLAAVADELAGHPEDTDFVLALEILAPDDGAVFGIECYIVGRDGVDAFSFLLNEHHAMFAEARLVASGDSLEARDALVDAATRLAMQALSDQIAEAQQDPEGEGD